MAQRKQTGRTVELTKDVINDLAGDNTYSFDRQFDSEAAVQTIETPLEELQVIKKNNHLLVDYSNIASGENARRTQASLQFMPVLTTSVLQQIGRAEWWPAIADQVESVYLDDRGGITLRMPKNETALDVLAVERFTDTRKSGLDIRNVTVQEFGAYNPELKIMNANDRTRALGLFAGIFRIICTNGLIDDIMGSHLIMRHRASDARRNRLDIRVENFIKNIPDFFLNSDAITSLHAQEITDKQKEAFVGLLAEYQKDLKTQKMYTTTKVYREIADKTLRFGTKVAPKLRNMLDWQNIVSYGLRDNQRYMTRQFFGRMNNMMKTAIAA